MDVPVGSPSQRFDPTIAALDAEVARNIHVLTELQVAVEALAERVLRLERLTARYESEHGTLDAFVVDTRPAAGGQ